MFSKNDDEKYTKMFKPNLKKSSKITVLVWVTTFES